MLQTLFDIFVSHLPFAMQIMLTVLLRGYDWQVNVNEPVVHFPLTLPALGLPMTFFKLLRPLPDADREE